MLRLPHRPRRGARRARGPTAHIAPHGRPCRSPLQRDRHAGHRRAGTAQGHLGGDRRRRRSSPPWWPTRIAVVVGSIRTVAGAPTWAASLTATTETVSALAGFRPVSVVDRVVFGKVATWPVGPGHPVGHHRTARADVGRRLPGDLRRRRTCCHRGRAAPRRPRSGRCNVEPDVVHPPAEVGGVLVTADAEDDPRRLTGQRAEVDPGRAVAVAVPTEDLNLPVSSMVCFGPFT